MKRSQRSLVVVSLSGFCVVMASASFLEACVKEDRAFGSQSRRDSLLNHGVG